MNKSQSLKDIVEYKQNDCNIGCLFILEKIKCGKRQ